VVGPGTECLPSPGAGPPDCTSLRHASDASLWCACRAPSSARAPTFGDPHLDDLVPTGWRVGQRLPRCCFQHHGDDPSLLRLGDRLWCLIPHHSHCRHALSLSSPLSSHPSSIVVGNGSTLPVTSVGASVLPGPLYLNDVLVAPHITHNLLSIHRFTTDNSCSIEFDPAGFSVGSGHQDPSHPLRQLGTALHAPALHRRRVSTSRPGLHHLLHHLASSSWPS
jgi:hypothetical protein